MMFKIGDRVKVIDIKFWEQHDEVGVVFLIKGGYIHVSYTYNGIDSTCPYYEKEIVKVGPRPGEQLLFKFMEPKDV